jgi:hypothetical protein
MEEDLGEIRVDSLLTDAERSLLCTRSDAYRTNPGAAIPIEEALERIERSLA